MAAQNLLQMPESFVITGCAGFIGSSMVDRLLAAGHRVTGIDNFSTGQRRFLQGALANSAFRLVEADLLDQSALDDAFAGGDCVFHFAANADVRFGTDHPIYCRWAMMQMERRRDFIWQAKSAHDFLVRPDDWPETRYERKARNVFGHDVWYFRWRRI